VRWRSGGGRRPHARHGPHSSSRIHGGAIVAGVAAARGPKTGIPIPKQIVIDGPIVTKANAPGMLWREEQFLI
jgi:ribose transport system substrate-binding protein